MIENAVLTTIDNKVMMSSSLTSSDNNNNQAGIVVDDDNDDNDDDEAASSIQRIPLFDFSLPSLNNATNQFERIDDVIMGGISSSLLRQVEGETFARWSGICRTDGGYGFVLFFSS